jgi:hypothetical protein
MSGGAWQRRQTRPMNCMTKDGVVYMRPHDLSHSHTVCCTPPQHREGG